MIDKELKNKPLTLEQLKNMVGKSIWVKSTIDNKIYYIYNISSVIKGGKAMGVYIDGNRKRIRYDLNNFYKHKSSGGINDN